MTGPACVCGHLDAEHSLRGHAPCVVCRCPHYQPCAGATPPLSDEAEWNELFGMLEYLRTHESDEVPANARRCDGCGEMILLPLGMWIAEGCTFYHTEACVPSDERRPRIVLHG